MAGGNTGELWFEMGVRDKVASAMEKDIALSKQLQGSIDAVLNSYKDLSRKEKKEVDSMVASANKYLGALTKINEVRSRLRETRTRAFSLGLNTDEIDQAIYKLNGFHSSYVRTAKKFGADSARMHMMLGAQFTHRMSWLGSLVTKYNQLIKTEEQEGVAAVQSQIKANKSLVDSYDKVTKSSRQTMSTLSMLRQQAGYYFSLFGAQTLLRNVITIGGQFEFQHVALQNIIGDAEKATALFAQLKDLAVESPKTFMELTTSAKQLSAYQIPVNELYDTTKRLSDLSVGLGVDMNRLILAYGQVRSAAVLRGQELRQFTEAGIPLVQALADKFTKLNGRVTTTADVFKLIQTRAVPFEMVKEVLWDMTNQGGQFYNMQATMADTLYGKWQKLADIWQITLGNMADANSMSGKFFKTALDGFIFLARNLQSLIPMLGVFGLYKAGRSIKNNYFGGMDAIDSNISKAQKLNEITLRRRRLIGEITEKEYQDGIALNRKKSSYYELLAMEGKISDKKIAQLAADNKMNKLLAYRLLLMEGYSKEQIRTAMANKGQGLAGNFSARNFGSKALSFMGGWTGVAFEAAGIAASIYQAYNSWSDKIEERVNSTVAKAREATRGISEAFSDFNKYGQPKDVEEMRERVERMKQILVNSDMYTDTVRQQVESAGSLNEQYNTLLKTLKDAKEQADYIISNKNNLAEAIKATSGSFDIGKIASSFVTGGLTGAIAEADTQIFGWIFNDDITKNLEQYREALGNIESQMHSISAYENEYASAITKMSESYSGFAALVEGKSPEEAIKAIAKSGYWEEFANKVDKSDTGFRKLVKKLIDYSDTADNHLQEIVDDDIEKMLKKLAEQRGMELGEYKKWLNEHPAQARRVVNEIIEVMNLGGRALIGFTNKLRAAIGLDPISFEQQAVDLQKKAYHDQTQAGKNVLGTLMKGARENGWGDKYGNGVWDVKWINKFFEGGTSYQEGLKSMRNAWANLKEEREAAAKAGGKLSSIEEAEFQRLDKAASVFDFKEKKSKIFGNANKASGGSKTDAELEAVKNRVELYKKFYQELKGYEDLYGEFGALEKLRKDGEFDEVFAWKIKDITDYGSAINQLTSGLEANTVERKRFLDLSKTDIQAKARAKETEAIKAYVGELQKMLNIMSENYNTYKKWVDLTGDSSLAARIAGVTQNTSYAEYLSNQMEKELGNRGLALTPADVFGMTEEEVRKLGKDNSIYMVWEEWRKNQQKIRKDQLDLYEEAIKNSKDYEDKIDDVNRKLKKQIEAIETLSVSDEERGRLSKNAQKNAEKEISAIKWDKFKEENDWGRVFGNLDNVSLQGIRNMITAMKEYAKTTKMDVTETKAWYEALDKLTDKQTILDPLTVLSESLKAYQSSHGKIAIIDEQIERTRNNSGLSAAEKERIINQLQEERNKLLDQEAEALTKASKALKAFASNIGKLGSALKQLGDSVGGNFGDVINGIGGMLGDLSTGMDSVGDLAQAMSQKGFTGTINKVSAALGIISSTIGFVKKLDSLLPSTESIYERYAEKQRKINELRQSIDDYEVEALKRAIKNQNWLYSNGLSEIRSNGYVRKNLLKNYANTQLAPQEIYQDARSGLAKWAPAIVGAIVGIVAGAVTFGLGSIGGAALGTAMATALGATGTAAIGAALAAGAGAAIGTALRSAGDEIFYKEGQTAARDNLRVQTRHKTAFRSEKTQNLEEWVRKNYGKELFDKDNYDLIDIELAKEILKNGPPLVGETRETLERLIEIAEQIQEIQDQVHDYVGEMFSPLIDNMTDSLWDWLSSGKDMMDSFYDYASDTFANIAKDAVKSFLKINLLDKYTKTLEDTFNAYSLGVYNEAQLMSSVASVAGEIGTSFEILAPVLQEMGKILEDSFKYYGYDITGKGSGSSSTSQVLSGLSEADQGLFMSYVNGIRGDVSVMRTLAEQEAGTLTGMNATVQLQLRELEAISVNTRRNADSAEFIETFCRGLRDGEYTIKVK